jgi:integrating conjugative element protein (TIGR03757 family)
MHRRCRFLLAGTLALAASSLCTAAEPPLPTRIEVFATEASPVAAAVPGLTLPVTVYDLDAPARWEATLSEELPAQPEQAQPIAQERIAQLDPEALKGAYTGLMQALRYRIDRYPAIVFDEGRAVVYGVPDLEQALVHYRHWRAAETAP